jgi:hypothetical protein
MGKRRFDHRTGFSAVDFNKYLVSGGLKIPFFSRGASQSVLSLSGHFAQF